MSEQFYMDDKEIADEVFDGEPVAGDNTISKSKNIMLKRKARDLINGIFNVPAGTIMADTFNLLKAFAFVIYKRVLDDDKAIPIREEDNAMIKLIARRYKLVALWHFRPGDR